MCVCARSHSSFCTDSVNVVRDGRGDAAEEIINSISYHFTGVLIPASAVY